MSRTGRRLRAWWKEDVSLFSRFIRFIRFGCQIPGLYYFYVKRDFFIYK